MNSLQIRVGYLQNINLGQRHYTRISYDHMKHFVQTAIAPLSSLIKVYTTHVCAENTREMTIFLFSFVVSP